MAHVWTRAAEYESLPAARAAFRQVQTFLFDHPNQAASAMCIVLNQPSVLVHCFVAPPDVFASGIEQVLAGGRPVSVPRDVVLMASMRMARRMLAKEGVERPNGMREYSWAGDAGGSVRMVLPDGQDFDVPGELVRNLLPPDVRGEN